jgi:type I restriction enzyme S subunit
MKVRLRKILKNLRQEFDEELGEQLKALYLYGSQARGDARSDSDIDVLAVIQGDFDYFEMLDRTSRAVGDLSLANDVVISRAFVSADDFQRGQTPFLLNVQREGIAI